MRITKLLLVTGWLSRQAVHILDVYCKLGRRLANRQTVQRSLAQSRDVVSLQIGDVVRGLPNPKCSFCETSPEPYFYLCPHYTPLDHRVTTVVRCQRPRAIRVTKTELWYRMVPNPDDTSTLQGTVDQTVPETPDALKVRLPLQCVSFVHYCY